LRDHTEMVEGFWIVQFESVQGKGAGVVVLLKGRILGGDNGFIYRGVYETDEKTFSGRVSVHNFLPGVSSVLGVQGEVELALKGTVEGDTIKGAASVVNLEAAGIVVKLTRVGDLPR
jgi:hypothetical protein